MIECPNCGSEDAYFDVFSLKYECPDCGHKWETGLEIEGQDSLKCPECGSSDCEETGDGVMYRCQHCGNLFSK